MPRRGRQGRRETSARLYDTVEHIDERAGCLGSTMKDEQHGVGELGDFLEDEGTTGQNDGDNAVVVDTDLPEELNLARRNLET